MLQLFLFKIYIFQTFYCLHNIKRIKYNACIIVTTCGPPIYLYFNESMFGESHSPFSLQTLHTTVSAKISYSRYSIHTSHNIKFVELCKLYRFSFQLVILQYMQILLGVCNQWVCKDILPFSLLLKLWSCDDVY